MSAVAIVTGAGTGIGRSIARALADRGLNVLAVGRRGGPLEEACSHAPQRMRPLPADVADASGRQRIRDAVGADQVRCLVHNAGLLEPVGLLPSITLAQWRAAQAVNVEAPLFLTQALLDRLPGGRVLHISSGAAHNAYAGWSSYCVSKAALYMLYQVLREELPERGIGIGSLRPGVVDTPMQTRVRHESPERFPRVQRFADLHASGRLEDPDQVAAFAAWLLMDVADDAFGAEEWSFTDPDQRARWERQA